MERYTKRLTNGVASWDYSNDCYGVDETRNKVFRSVHRQNACERLAAYEDTGLTPEEVNQMRWIPVKERLPKPEENPVIAFDCTGPVIAWYSKAMGWVYRTGMSGVDITHWMPLPHPPKEAAHD